MGYSPWGHGELGTTEWLRNSSNPPEKSRVDPCYAVLHAHLSKLNPLSVLCYLKRPNTPQAHAKLF